MADGRSCEGKELKASYNVENISLHCTRAACEKCAQSYKWKMAMTMAISVLISVFFLSQRSLVPVEESFLARLSATDLSFSLISACRFADTALIPFTFSNTLWCRQYIYCIYMNGKWVLFILLLNWASPKGIIPTIHAFSQYILPTASHICPSFPLRMVVDCVFHHEADQLLLYVSKLSPWGCIFKLSHNHWSVSCLTAANCGSNTESASVWWQISHCVDVIPSGLAPNLSPRGGSDLSP